MFEEKKSNQNQGQPLPENLPIQDNISEEEKKLFGEDEGSGNGVDFSKPPVTIPKEFVKKKSKKKSFLLAFFIIIVALGLAILVLANIVSNDWLTKTFSTEPKPEQPVTPADGFYPIDEPMTTRSMPKSIAEIDCQIDFYWQIDSDGDGLSDCQEIEIYGTDPFNPDSDGDGLSDWEEIYIWGTDPLNPDTDGDGYLDGEEVKAGYDPLDPTPGARLFNLDEAMEKLEEKEGEEVLENKELE